MIDARDIEREISLLEGSRITYEVCAKLANLYIIRDHQRKAEEHEEKEIFKVVNNYSRAQSDFLDACEGVPIDDVLSVIDEHLQAVRAIYPKEYSLVLEKIKGTRI